MNGLFTKLKDRRGETLVETLVSVLIVSAVFLMLSTAIVTAANINAKTKNIDSTFNADDAIVPDDAGQYELKVWNVATDSSAPLDAKKYTVYTSNGYVFYKHNKASQNDVLNNG